MELIIETTTSFYEVIVKGEIVFLVKKKVKEGYSSSVPVGTEEWGDEIRFIPLGDNRIRLELWRDGKFIIRTSAIKALHQI
ncbi:hypothetical protein J7K24_02890 [bacterium]|nr:hypothetical protein [bacterium]